PCPAGSAATLPRAASTRLTHDAQLMPSMESSMVLDGTSKPTFSIACTSALRLVPAVACTSARSVAKLTATCCTPGTLRIAASTRPTQDAHVMPSMGREMSTLLAVGVLGPDVMVGSL